MRLTTKGRYAVTAMLDLAIHDRGQPTALADIAERQSLSLSYLEQLFAQLRRGQLVSSVRGPGGGYQLAREPQRINIAEIIHAVDEVVDVTRCGGAATVRMAANVWPMTCGWGCRPRFAISSSRSRCPTWWKSPTCWMSPRARTIACRALVMNVPRRWLPACAASVPDARPRPSFG